MNRKEIAEIRKNFKDESGFFTINQVLMSFVDAEKNITCKSHKLYSIMSGSEGELIRETLKKSWVEVSARHCLNINSQMLNMKKTAHRIFCIKH